MPLSGAPGDHRPVGPWPPLPGRCSPTTPGLRQPPRAGAAEPGPGPWPRRMAGVRALLQKPSPSKQLQSERGVSFLHAKPALGVM